MRKSTSRGSFIVAAMVFLAGAVILLAANAWLDADDETLQFYLDQAEVVMLGEFTSEPIGTMTEGGVIHYQADFEIEQIIKGGELGARRVGGTITANIVRFEFEEADKLPEIAKGGRCILFMLCNDRQETPSYLTIDIWFGVQRASPTLAKSLARLVGEE